MQSEIHYEKLMLKEKSRGRQLKKNDSCTCLGWVRPNTCLEWRSDLHRLAGKENNRCSSWMCASKCSSFLSLPFERSLDFQAVKRVYISTRYLAPASQGIVIGTSRYSCCIRSCLFSKNTRENQSINFD